MKKYNFFVCLIICFLFTFNSCHNNLVVKNTNVKKELIINAKAIIDTDFSSIEQNLIEKSINGWVVPLDGLAKISISESPNDELEENIIHQQLVMKQEKVDNELNNILVDPHDSWDPFDSRTPFWDTNEGCTDKFLILRMKSFDPIVINMEKAAGVNFLGLTNNSCHEKIIFIIIDRIKNEQEFIAVVTHEIGHMFGLKHIFEKDKSVMHPKNYSSNCVTNYDLEMFCKRWKCKNEFDLISKCTNMQ